MTVEIEFLKSTPYFTALSTADLEAIKRHVFEKSADRGELLLLEEEPAEAVYFVVSGVLKAFKTSAEGKEQVLCLLRPGDSFNDVPIFDSGLNPASIIAMTPVTLYAISKTDIQTLLREYPSIAINIIKVLAGKVRHFVSLVEDLSFRHVIGRIAKLLLDYAGDGASPRPRLTQQDMAAIVGSAREVVGRSLKSLEEEGAIKMERNRIVVTDKEILEKMVKAPS